MTESKNNESIIRNALGKGRVVNSDKNVTSSLKKECEGKGVDLFGEDRMNEIGFDQIKKVRRFKEKKEIDLWGNQEFVRYVKRLHFERFSRRLQIKMPPACVYIQRIQDAILDILGFCDNVVLRDYCDYFFRKDAARLAAKYNGFHFAQMLYSNIIVEFACKYRYRSNRPIPADKQCIAAEDIENAYILGPDILVRDFGIIIAMNWLILREGFGSDAAACYLLESLRKMCQNKQFNFVKLATERWNPYPIWLPFTAVKELLRKIDTSLDIAVMVSSDLDHKFAFLRRQQQADG